MIPAADPPLDTGPVTRRAPDGACDAHVHMLAAPEEAPLWDGRVEDPAPGWTFDRYLAAYRAQCEALNVSRTVVVHSILYGTDNAVTARAVAALGRDRARGIGLVRDDATDADLDVLVGAGIVGVRLNYVHGGVLSWDGVEAMAPRLAERGLHVQMLARADHLPDLAPRIRAMPVDVVLDHMAWPAVAAGPAAPGFRALRDLVADRAAWVKLSAPYRVCADPYDDALPLVRSLLDAAPERCVWGSDWPHIMLGDAARPRSGALLDVLARATDEAEWRTVLVDAPAALYGLSDN
ncbi:amidohydrolase family protein [Jannaschia sp. Os4]|uniref:amidohydrolase family protein n=1 Tax=Jannaschia sp. Os4 TaxID=2807617 RepID=UPI00193A7803|nr:amidohydrolase family protein [Jannaschia sp. Os4]MBM2577690.1 amidohydrolase family protein [Jannaschia sp. Os4]